MNIKKTFIYAAAIAGYAAALGFFWVETPGFAHENGPMENAQVLALSVALVFAVLSAVRWKEFPLRFISCACALLFLNFILREVDFDRLDLPAVIISLGSGTGRNILLGGLWVGLFAWGIRKRGELLSQWKVIVSSGFFPLIVAGGLFYVASWPFDKHMLALAPEVDLFLEELTECCATLLLALGSFRLFRP